MLSSTEIQQEANSIDRKRKYVPCRFSQGITSTLHWNGTSNLILSLNILIKQINNLCLQSSLYESWLSTPMRHLTLTGTSELAAITDIASATNFSSKSRNVNQIQLTNKLTAMNSSTKQNVVSTIIQTFGSSIRRTPKHPCPATFGLGHPQLEDEQDLSSLMKMKNLKRLAKVIEHT